LYLALLPASIIFLFPIQKTCERGIFYEQEQPLFARFVERGAEKNVPFFSAPLSTNLAIPFGWGVAPQADGEDTKKTSTCKRAALPRRITTRFFEMREVKNFKFFTSLISKNRVKRGCGVGFG
jgi:hypothetical protein